MDPSKISMKVIPNKRKINILQYFLFHTPFLRKVNYASTWGVSYFIFYSSLDPTMFNKRSFISSHTGLSDYYVLFWKDEFLKFSIDKSWIEQSFSVKVLNGFWPLRMHNVTIFPCRISIKSNKVSRATTNETEGGLPKKEL